MNAMIPKPAATKMKRSMHWPSPSVRRVVVGIGLDRGSSHALVWADTIARAMDAELCVVHIVPAIGSVRTLVHEAPAEIAGAAPIARACMGSVRRWSETTLGHALAPGAVAIGRGPVARALHEAVDELDPEVLVLGTGSLARTFVRRTRRPLLVARPMSGTARILAFTDFSDRRLPVLRRAARLGRRMGAEVTFAGYRGDPDLDPQENPRLTLLRSLACEYHQQPIEVLSSNQELSTIAALAAVQLHAPSLIAVPTHPWRRTKAVARGGIGCRIAAFASSSVLVVPIESGGEAA